MTKTSLLRYAAIGMASVSLAGVAAASTVSFDTTGADSNQEVHIGNHSKLKTTNHNDVAVGNFNAQVAASGDVDAYKNTTVSGASGSGDAMNENTTRTEVEVTNSGAGAGLASWFGQSANDVVTIDNTGADSNQHVDINNTKTVEMTNVNSVEITNENVQAAKSGDVNASKNTTVGGLTSGDAHNSSSTTTSVRVGN